MIGVDSSRLDVLFHVTKSLREFGKVVERETWHKGNCARNHEECERPSRFVRNQCTVVFTLTGY